MKFKLVILLAGLLAIASCKKKETTTPFTYQGKWTIFYDWRPSLTTYGSYTADLKSSKKFDYEETGVSTTPDAGTWEVKGDSVLIKFNIGAIYRGKNSNNNVVHGIMHSSGVYSGTFTAVRD
jgi:hypothetical protein